MYTDNWVYLRTHTKYAHTLTHTHTHTHTLCVYPSEKQHWVCAATSVIVRYTDNPFQILFICIKAVPFHMACQTSFVLWFRGVWWGFVLQRNGRCVLLGLLVSEPRAWDDKTSLKDSCKLRLFWAHWTYSTSRNLNFAWLCFIRCGYEMAPNIINVSFTRITHSCIIVIDACIGSHQWQ